MVILKESPSFLKMKHICQFFPVIDTHINFISCIEFVLYTSAQFFHIVFPTHNFQHIEWPNVCHVFSSTSIRTCTDNTYIFIFDYITTMNFVTSNHILKCLVTFDVVQTLCLDTL